MLSASSSVPEPALLATQPPLALQQLVGELRGSDPPKVCTALVELSPAAAELAPGWAALLDLQAVHLGQVIAAQARADGTPDIGLDRAAHVLAYVRHLLPTPDRYAPPPGGIWLRGLDLLLAKLDDAQRVLCWRGLRHELPYLPPLVLALPATLPARFGLAASEWPMRRLSL